MQLLSLVEAPRSEYRPGAATSTGDSIRERQGRSVRGQDIVVGNSEVASPRLHTMPLAGGLRHSTTWNPARSASCPQHGVHMLPATYSTAQRSYVSTERGPAKLVRCAQLPCNLSHKGHPLQYIAPCPNTPARSDSIVGSKDVRTIA